LVISYSWLISAGAVARASTVKRMDHAAD
jgi:hypothetical protein